MILLEIESKKQIHHSKGDINMNSQKDIFLKIYLDDEPLNNVSVYVFVKTLHSLPEYSVTRYLYL